MDLDARPTLFVLAGADGAGKSSVGGALLRGLGLDYFAAEDFAREVLELERCPMDQALEQGLLEGQRRLEGAIKAGVSYAFETSLGGTVIPGLLRHAVARGFQVRMWFFGLDTADLHVTRVARRAAACGFPAPAELIRAQFVRSRENLVALMPAIEHLRVYDNSLERPPGAMGNPPPRLQLSLAGGQWQHPDRNGLIETARWARPIVEAAIERLGPPPH